MRPPVGADGCRYLVDYHYWASHRLLDVVEGLTGEQFAREVGGGFPSVQKTLSHLIDAEGFYLYVLGQERPPRLTAADPVDGAAARGLWAERERLMAAYAAALDDAACERPFQDPRGFETSPALVLVQMVNHGTHHRGQITTMLRQVGAVPQSMELLMYAVP
ncbi:MAG TPA: DinB family protein [Bacillota bacterium]|nr:DinB family protein [Bacillota bacterium]